MKVEDWDLLEDARKILVNGLTISRLAARYHPEVISLRAAMKSPPAGGVIEFKTGDDKKDSVLNSPEGAYVCVNEASFQKWLEWDKKYHAVINSKKTPMPPYKDGVARIKFSSSAIEQTKKWDVSI